MTRNGWVWLLLLVLTGILATLRGGTVSYLLFYASVLTPASAFSYLLYVYFRFRIFQSVGSLRIVKEAAVPYGFALANEDFIAYHNVSVLFLTDYSTTEGLESGRPVCLLPGEKWSKNTVLRCHYRGEYQVGIGRVVVRDFLSLFRITYRVSNPIRVRVLPRIVELTRFTLAEDADGRRERRTPARIPETPDAQVRRYEHGDPVRQIHWKATARQQRLMTRQMQEEPKDEVALLFTTERYPGKEKERIEAEDKVIEAALALTAYHIGRGTGVRICWFDADGKEFRSLFVPDRKGLTEFYQVCCDLRFSDETEFAERYVRIRDALGLSGVCYLIAFLQQERKLAGPLAESLSAGSRPAVVLVGGTERPAGSGGKAGAGLGESIPVCRIPFGEAVKKCMEN